MTDVAFAGGVLAGAILVGAAWYGRFVWKYRPVDEQEVDRLTTTGREASK